MMPSLLLKSDSKLSLASLSTDNPWVKLGEI